MVLKICMTIIYNQSQYKGTRKILRNNSTEAEKILWDKLKNNQLGVKFRRQHGIGGYIADFCAPRKKLVIEIDGKIHLEKIQRLYYHGRQLDIECLGFKVIRFTNEAIFHDLNKVLEEIKQRISNINL